MPGASDWMQSSLAGLEATAIQIDTTGLGLGAETEAAVRREAYEAVEANMREGGLSVLPALEEVVLTRNAALFTVGISLQRRPDTDFVAFTLYTQVTQMARLHRSGARTPAITWRRIGTGLARPEEFWPSVLAGIGQQVEAFLRDHRAAQDGTETD